MMPPSASARRRGSAPKLAVIVIGTTGRVALANKGRIDVIVTVRGKAAHSSTPWVGRQCHRRRAPGARARAGRRCRSAASIPASARPRLTPTAMRSWPEATHTVQDEVRLVFDRRLLPGDDPQRGFCGRLRRPADIGGRGQVKTELGPFMYPAEIAPDGAFMRAAAKRLPTCGAASRRRPSTVMARSMPASSAPGRRGGDVGAGGRRAMALRRRAHRGRRSRRGRCSYRGMIEEDLCQMSEHESGAVHRLRHDREAAARCPTRWRSAKTCFACTRATR